MRKQICGILVLAVMLAVLQPAFSFAVGTGEEYQFQHDENTANPSAFLSRQGAIVGKVIGKSDITDQYIIYGRMSLLSPDGYRVYKTGKFFYIDPRTEEREKFVEERIGKGIKAFGMLEGVRQTVNMEVLYADSIIEYKPEDDAGVMEPAYGPKSGPFKWIGFGVAQKQYKVDNINFIKSTDVVNMIAHLMTPVLQNGRFLRSELKGRDYETNIYELETKKDFKLEEVVKALTTDRSPDNPLPFLPENNPKFKQPIRLFWQTTFDQAWLLERNFTAYDQMSKSLRGFVFVLGQKGKANNLLEEVTVIRPDIDDFMKYIEDQLGDASFSEWASPAVFYGMIDGSPNREVFSCPTPRPIPGTMRYETPDYIGPYYPEDEPDKFIGAIVEVKEGRIPKVNSDDPAAHYRDIERWPIGYQGEGSLFPGLTPWQYQQYSGQYVWMTGTRILVYEVTICGEDGCTTHIEHIEYGKLETENLPEGTTVTLIGYYIKPDHIIIKPQYNYMLNLIRELFFKGGV